MRPYQWRELAMNRILRILKTRRVASLPQLESKISESGPFHMRAEPHHLKSALDKLLGDERIRIVATADKTQIYAHPSFDKSNEGDGQRLAFILQHYNKYLSIVTSPKGGKPLEAVVQASIQEVGPSLHWFGGPGKVPPGRIFDDRSFTGHGELDHLILNSGTDLIGVEDKNYRAWIYPHSPLIRSHLKKCALYNVTPLFITRRLPFISRKVLSAIGVLGFQTYYQFLSPDLAKSLKHARHKDGLGFHDIRFSLDPLPTLVNYLRVSLPSLIPEARRSFEANIELIKAYAVDEDIDYKQFIDELQPFLSPDTIEEGP